MAQYNLGRVQGLSAYEVAVQNGYIGTEEEWLTWIKAKNGTEVEINSELQPNVNLISSGETVESLNGKKFASNTDIVKDRTGRTTEQINRVFYKQNCKEFTSDGSAITVNNGMDGYVLSSTLQGQTVKNILKYGEWLKTNTAGTPVTFYATWDNKMNITVLSSNTTSGSLIRGALNVQANKTYYILTENPIGLDCIYASTGASFKPTTIKSGVYQITPNNTDTIGFRLNASTIPYFLGKMYVFEDSLPNISFDTYLQPNSLYSTQATISNNGLKYSFVKDGAVIDLGGVGGLNGILSINEEGSVTYTQNTKQIILTTTTTTLTDAKAGTPIIASGTATISGNVVTGTVGETVRYQLATPVVTPIDKSLVPTVMTQLSNTFSFGDAVKPSKVTISVPINKIADLETRLAQLEAVVTSTSNLSLMANYVDDEYNNSLNQM